MNPEFPIPQSTKISTRFLPLISKKQSRQLTEAVWQNENAKQKSQQSLLLQLQDINSSLVNRNFSCHYGNLFSHEIDDRVIGEVRMCLKRASVIMEYGFYLFNYGKFVRYREHSQEKHLTKKIDTVNEKIERLSMQNVYNYDRYKYQQIKNSNKNIWSIYKRLDSNTQKSKLTSALCNCSSYQNTHRKQNSSPVENKSIIRYRNHSQNNSQIKFDENGEGASMGRKKIDGERKYWLKVDGRKGNGKNRKKVFMELMEKDNPEDGICKITYEDIKNMLKRQSDNLIFIWLPPSACPQFHGMFTYFQTKKSGRCRLKKYFFFKRSLNHRFFNSIIQEISSQENKYIESIELTTGKNQYLKIYQPLGWRMKGLENMEKIRIIYERQTQ